jgi:hypothetical protein
MKKEAQEEVALLLKSYPDFGRHAYEEFRKWWWVESEIDGIVQGLRDAGMNIPSIAQPIRVSPDRSRSLVACGEATHLRDGTPLPENEDAEQPSPEGNRGESAHFHRCCGRSAIANGRLAGSADGGPR